MALVLKDRVRETSTTTGTGTLTLAGAVAGFQSFSSVGTGNTTYYSIVLSPDWEVGIGTWTSPNQLSRDTILASTNGGAAVNFGAGTKDVFVTYPAEKSVNINANNGDATINGMTVGLGGGQDPNNVAIGANAMCNASGAGYNVAIGAQALANDTQGNNLAIGNGALSQNINGFNNVALGTECMYAADNANGDIAIGYHALYYDTGGSNVGIGYTALGLNQTGYNNIGIGNAALYSNLIGANNMAIGSNALYSNQTGDNNTAIGSSALYNNQNGNYNTAIGFSALSGNLTGSGNFAVGYNAMNFSQYGSNNFAIGANAAALVGYVTTDANNFAFGNSALNFAGSIDPASNNIAIGNNAMANAGTNGGAVSSNVAIGNYALSGAGVSSPNALSNTIAIGYNSGASIDGGTNNVIIGGYTGATAPISITGSNYVILSSGSGTVRQTFNGSGALSFNAGTSYGTAGQLLQSNGSGAAPSWGRTITSGTAAPSGGADGDIYLQYV
ncbi:hypothetical protein UFOVP830_57 [uncultured Caudovirales phage]|uniref:Uncharacterized protein n=1 Tax=uncultured Caudovirales phage TaxID=2100421 RepID=A0A6J5NYN0_9CAUD|nr:hypothetical protein UFOVP830_57 [uncultured Caudovirales phage]